MCTTTSFEERITESQLIEAFNQLAKRQQRLSDILLRLLQESGTAGDKSLLSLSLREEFERITRGVPALRGEFPDCCVIGIRQSGGVVNWRFSGVLIHPKVVVTAGHAVRTNALTVALNTNEVESMEKEIINVRKAHIHKKYTPINRTNDIALLVLEKPCTSVKPVELASVAQLGDSRKVTLVGFGNESVILHSSFGIKRKVGADIVSLARARNTNLDEDEGKFGFESDIEFVAGGNGFDTCLGDSGGPAYILHDQKYKLFGITSRPIREAPERCGSGGIYTRIDKQHDFINEIIGSL